MEWRGAEGISRVRDVSCVCVCERERGGEGGEGGLSRLGLDLSI